MRRIALIVMVCALAAGCGQGSSGTSEPADTGSPNDAVSDTAPDNQADTGHTDDTCICSNDGPCCDGCQPTNVGQDCDDDQSCTLGTTCQDDGTCGGATGTPCDDEITSPQCQQAMCDETEGCTVEAVREGLPCDDGDPQTYDDECRSGSCQGTPCECDTENTCCDGCRPRNEGASCDNGDNIDDNASCNASGECVEDPCNCSDADDQCCDGCHWMKGVSCYSSTQSSSCASTQCGGTINKQVCDVVCSPEDNWSCSGDVVENCRMETETCSSTNSCQKVADDFYDCQLDSSCQ